MENEKLAKLFNYGDYSSSNYGAHCMGLEIPATNKSKHGITLYFSYNTLVAFRGWIDNKPCFYAIKNYWGNTTGKHLNWLDGGSKESRLDENLFNRLFNKAMKNA